MQHFIAGLSNFGVRNTEWVEKKIKTVPHLFYDSAEVYIRQKQTYAEQEQFKNNRGFKLCKNLRTTRLGQN